MKNEEQEKKSAFHQRFDMQALLARRDLIVLTGDSRATLHGCRRILRYSPCEIRLCIGRREVSLTGERLICTCFSGGSVTVEGVIRAVSFLPSSGGSRR